MEQQHTDLNFHENTLLYHYTTLWIYSLAGQTFARRSGRSGDISIYPCSLQLPKYGKDQLDYSVQWRVQNEG